MQLDTADTVSVSACVTHSQGYINEWKTICERGLDCYGLLGNEPKRIELLQPGWVNCVATLAEPHMHVLD